VLVDDGLLMVTLALAIGTGPPTLAVIPSVAANSDPTAIAAYFAGGFQNFETTSALFVIEACADAAQVSQSLLEAQAAALPRWRTLVNTAYLDLCEKFDLHQVSDLTTAPASAVPVFVIRGALTPSSTRVDLSTFAAGLTYYSLLELPNESGSLASPPPCVQTLRMAFLRNPTTPLDTKTCAAADPPIPFPVS
jgi:hypothetical protein